MTIAELKFITDARLESASKLISVGDWFFAAYTMAMSLECALKALVCKTLDISTYPQNQKPKIVDFFWTHEFEQLQLLAGLGDTFSPSGIPEVFQKWSEFTKEFPGSWTTVKYDYARQQQFDRVKVERLYNALIDSSYGVITKIKEKW